MGKRREKLILGQKGDQREQEHMEFDPEKVGRSRPSPDVERAVAQGKTGYEKTGLSTGKLAQKGHEFALDKVQKYAGNRVDTKNITADERTWKPLEAMALSLLQDLISKEGRHKRELERLCEDIVRDYFGIEEDELQYKITLLGLQSIPIQGTKPNDELNMKQDELKLPQFELISHNAAKRRLINSLIQGHAIEGFYLADSQELFNNEGVEQRLINITGDRNIIQKYGTAASLMSLVQYWQYGDQFLDMVSGASGGEGQGSGKTEIQNETNPPTVNVEGMSFFILLHEAVKGTMEFLAQTDDPSEADLEAMDTEDQVQFETSDIRFGPVIWNLLYQSFPERVTRTLEAAEGADPRLQKRIRMYMYKKLANVPSKDLLIIMKEVFEQSQESKVLFAAMAYDIEQILDGEEIEDQNTEFFKQMERIKQKYRDTGVDELNDMLREMGIEEIGDF